MTIKEAREAKGFSQEKVTRELGITLRHYQDIEYGKHVPSVIVGLLLSDILDVSPYEIFKEKIKEFKESRNKPVL